MATLSITGSSLFQSKDRNILRIAVHSLGSPLWGEEQAVNQHDRQQGAELCQFLHALRALMRNSLAVCAITMPTHLFAVSGSSISMTT